MKYRILKRNEIVIDDAQVQNQKNPFISENKNNLKWTNDHTYYGEKVYECLGYITGLPRRFRVPIKTDNTVRRKNMKKPSAAQIKQKIIQNEMKLKRLKKELAEARQLKKDLTAQLRTLREQ